ncbi:MAG: hypothetical protein AB7V42_14410 [Thermoleophilia bacterium]
MTALARIHPPAAAAAPSPRPLLRAVPPSRRRLLPRARSVAFYALGLVAGFLLAALASTPGGTEVVAWQLTLALAAAVVAGLAALRARAVARRRRARPRLAPM